MKIDQLVYLKGISKPCYARREKILKAGKVLSKENSEKYYGEKNAQIGWHDFAFDRYIFRKIHNEHFVVIPEEIVKMTVEVVNGED